MYQKSLRLFATPYKRIEDKAKHLLMWLNFEEVLKRMEMAKQAQLAERVEMLISNIMACKQYKEIKACADFFMILKLQYPEMDANTHSLISNCLSKQEQIIKQK